MEREEVIGDVFRRSMESQQKTHGGDKDALKTSDHDAVQEAIRPILSAGGTKETTFYDAS